MYSVKHTPYRFALVVTDQNKFTGLVVVEEDQTGEITQLTSSRAGMVYDTQRVGKE